MEHCRIFFICCLLLSDFMIRLLWTDREFKHHKPDSHSGHVADFRGF
ncbi:Uncharacterized protein dnm_052240 [Desulfonema magnum]|uniref:Uncharacterized protein n=1 Tax=Desulfonema magnum TaxID=45655 RepID=A0A975GPU1_9BACT|nr:Uncharacterized protein dnm_052240 [Desulfonema magnum]